MKCLVINGTELKGCTYHLKELFLDELKPDELIEFYLPEDAPDYCIGCKRCFMEHENFCPHYLKVQPIWDAMQIADLIVFAIPVYAFGAPAQVKAVLDHIACHWFVHRPEPKLFDKTAAIICQSLGAPNRSAQNDIKTSLDWLGIAKTYRWSGHMMESADWSTLSKKRKDKLEQKIRRFAGKLTSIQPRRMRLKAKLYFTLGKFVQTMIRNGLDPNAEPPTDLKYWIHKGWIKPR